MELFNIFNAPISRAFNVCFTFSSLYNSVKMGNVCARLGFGVNLIGLSLSCR